MSQWLVARVTRAGGEQMMTLHAIPVKADARWTEPADKRLTLGLKIVVKINKLESNKFDADLQDPTSPNYHHRLPRGKARTEEDRRRFWPPPGKIEALADWLSTQGFQILEPDNSGLRISGTV